MTGDFLELIIIVFIIGAIGFLIWRGGAANPVGTGKLARQVGKVDGDVKALGRKFDELEGRVEQAASAEDVRRLEERMKAHDGKLAEVATDVAAMKRAVNHQTKQVDRLYDIIVAKGMNS